MTQTILDLTKQLIAIPSWVDNSCNESQIGEFIYQFLIKNSRLQVTKQYCYPNRFNVIAQNNNVAADLLVVGHMDTVQPSQSWTRNPTDPQIVDGNLYGLGSTDMKSGLAAMLLAAVNPNPKPNTMFLFYIDEEYDFLGMKKFIQEFQGKIKPKTIISLDGLDLKISNGCRGLIEIEFTLKGISGHAAQPQSGINAITKSFELISQLQIWLSNFNNPQLGATTLNVAYITGGQYQGQDQSGLILGKQGNIIPDICRFIIDIRPSNPNLTAQRIIDYIEVESQKLNLKLNSAKIRFDYKSWLTPKKNLPELGLDYNRIDQSGYIDIQLLWQSFNQVPCFTIGAGSITAAHKNNEFVKIGNLSKLQSILDKFLIIY